jgi:uncharacterized membrane protein HdeD (DUF308 family)
VLGQGLKALVKSVWWMFLLKGVVAIVFGLVALFMPGTAAMSLLMALGFYALFDGASTVWGAVKVRKLDGSWWLLALEGLLGVFIGWLALSRPGEVTLMFIFIFAFWAVFGGLLRIVLAIRLRKEIQGEFTLIAGGAMSVLFGVFLISRPVAGLLGVMWMIGGIALLIGIVMVMLAMKARGLAKQVAAA